MSRKRFNRRGLSPVIATVILVAVTIVVAVAIAYWMGGIAGLYTRYEQLEIVYANAVWNSTADYWEITLKVKNKGSAAATIDDILLNGISITNVKNGTSGDFYPANVTYCEGTPTWSNFGSIHNKTLSSNDITTTLNGGEEKYLAITLPNEAVMGSSTASSGLSLEIKLHTAAGREYPKLISLP